MSRGLVHPFTGLLYEPIDEQTVKVSAQDGREGLFRRDGRWLSGELFEADPHLCGWVAGPKVAHHRLKNDED